MFSSPLYYYYGLLLGLLWGPWRIENLAIRFVVSDVQSTRLSRLERCSTAVASFLKSQTLNIRRLFNGLLYWNFNKAEKILPFFPLPISYDGATLQATEAKRHGVQSCHFLPVMCAMSTSLLVLPSAKASVQGPSPDQ